jgi:hypothetical protein
MGLWVKCLQHHLSAHACVYVCVHVCVNVCVCERSSYSCTRGFLYLAPQHTCECCILYRRLYDQKGACVSTCVCVCVGCISAHVCVVVHGYDCCTHTTILVSYYVIATDQEGVSACTSEELLVGAGGYISEWMPCVHNDRIRIHVQKRKGSYLKDSVSQKRSAARQHTTSKQVVNGRHNRKTIDTTHTTQHSIRCHLQDSRAQQRSTQQHTADKWQVLESDPNGRPLVASMAATTAKLPTQQIIHSYLQHSRVPAVQHGSSAFHACLPRAQHHSTVCKKGNRWKVSEKVVSDYETAAPFTPACHARSTTPLCTHVYE